MIYSATRTQGRRRSRSSSKHMMFVTIGVAAMARVAAVDYVKLARLGLAALRACAIVSLGRRARAGVGACTRASGPGSTSARSRSSRPSSRRSPSIVAVASYLGTLDRAVSAPKHLVVALLMFGVPMGLIMLQPDLGTTLVFVIIAVGMLVVAGIPMRYLVALACWSASSASSASCSATRSTSTRRTG